MGEGDRVPLTGTLNMNKNTKVQIRNSHYFGMPP